MYPSYNNSTREGFLLLTHCLQPKSRGSVSLRSSNIRHQPKIDPAYLRDYDDVLCSHRGMEIPLRTTKRVLFFFFSTVLFFPLDALSDEGCKLFQLWTSPFRRSGRPSFASTARKFIILTWKSVGICRVTIETWNTRNACWGSRPWPAITFAAPAGWALPTIVQSSTRNYGKKFRSSVKLIRE